MHYKNGREAKNGDKVVLIQSYVDHAGKKQFGTPIVGILYDAKPGAEDCNGYLAPMQIAATADLKHCLHLDDFLAVQPETVPDTSKP